MYGLGVDAEHSRFWGTREWCFEIRRLEFHGSPTVLSSFSHWWGKV
jgi:hypothetical protein